MVDWMIEVLSSYRMSEETFFKSIYFMDAYLKNKKTKLEVKDLHLIGVTAMFAAAKYEEIHPLKLAVVYEKIARKKFKKTEILEMESEMVETLEFKLESPSIYDIARHTM
jgi:cyclin A